MLVHRQRYPLNGPVVKEADRVRNFADRASRKTLHVREETVMASFIETCRIFMIPEHWNR